MSAAQWSSARHHQLPLPAESGADNGRGPRGEEPDATIRLIKEALLHYLCSVQWDPRQALQAPPLPCLQRPPATKKCVGQQGCDVEDLSRLDARACPEPREGEAAQAAPRDAVAKGRPESVPWPLGLALQQVSSGSPCGAPDAGRTAAVQPEPGWAPDRDQALAGSAGPGPPTPLAKPGLSSRLTCTFRTSVSVAEAQKLVPRLIGKSGRNMKTIAGMCNGKVRIRGRGSGYLEGSKMREADVPLQVVLSCAAAEDLRLGRQLLAELLGSAGCGFSAQEQQTPGSPGARRRRRRAWAVPGPGRLGAAGAGAPAPAGGWPGGASAPASPGSSCGAGAGGAWVAPRAPAPAAARRAGET